MSLSDFNDLHVAAGLSAVQAQLRAGLQSASTDAVDADDVPFSDDDERGDIPPSDDSPGPSDGVQPLSIEGALERFALAMPDGKVWDAHKRQLLKKTAARDMLGKKLWEAWLNDPQRRTVDQAVVRPQAAAAAAVGGGGLSKALERYVYLYPSSDAWDLHKRQRVPLSALKHAIADCFDDWIKSDRRREIDVERLVFDPTQRSSPITHINTFRGLPLVPSRNDAKCQWICALIQHLCNDNQEVMYWLMRWLAYPLQHVGAKMASAVLMHSHIQGSGKSLLFEEVLKTIYGEYSSTLSQHQLESQYTDWRSQLLFGLFEEIFSRDQKYSHTGTLKHMITGKTQRIEKKFVSGWEEANFMNAVFLSNEIQPFPVEATDRRMLVIWPKRKMPDEMKANVLNEVRNGGIEAFYALLLAYPLDGFGTHTEPPMTEEKERLIDFGRPAWEVFYIEWRNDCLEAPYMPCLSDSLFAVYRRWCERRREHVVSQTKFGGFLAAQEGVTRRRDVHYDVGQGKRKGTFFVPREPRDEFKQREGEAQAAWLGRCQQRFDQMLGPQAAPAV